MKFYIPDHGETAADAREFPYGSGGGCTVWAAQVAADFYHAHGGWEATWPIVFVIIDEGTERRFNVEREMVPEFIATPA